MSKFYNELMEGLEAMEAFLDGKRTLKRPTPLDMQADEIKSFASLICP